MGRCSLGVALLALTACGGEKYQYLESEDGHMFARIPKDWERPA